MDGDRPLIRRWIMAAIALAAAIVALAVAGHRRLDQHPGISPDRQPGALRAGARSGDRGAEAPPPPRFTAEAPEPHPMSPERRRMEQQHHLFDRVEAAIELRQFDRARALLHEHRARFSRPDDWTDLRAGWQAIADCLEGTDSGARARGQRFVDEERGSSLRRRVRRACLEPAP